MPGDDLNVLSALLAVAEARSFTKAARRLGVSPSAVSHAIRGLEERTGVRLLSRTTRSVAPTEAGERLIARLQPALGDVREALDELVRRAIDRRAASVSPSRRWAPRSCSRRSSPPSRPRIPTSRSR
jgi:DNA-binding transcriptional LysR family regulator